MKFDGRFSQTKLMSRLSHKVYRLLSSPVLLRKFTNSLLKGKERGYTFENIYLYIVPSFVRVCNFFKACKINPVLLHFSIAVLTRSTSDQRSTKFEMS